MTSTQSITLNRMFLAGISMILALAPGRMLADTSAAPAPISYSTERVINEGDSPAVIVEKAAKVLPRPNQTAWMLLERTFFLHFGVNTFNEVEWGRRFRQDHSQS